jgi:hypothetical protein
VRKRGDAVVQAKAELHRCRSVPTPGGGVPSCHDQKKALDKAQLRLQEAEEKVRAVRYWGAVVQHEVAEYQGRANQLTVLLEGDLPRAVAALDRIVSALDSYLTIGAAAAGPAFSTARTGAGEPPAPPAGSEPVAGGPAQPAGKAAGDIPATSGGDASP